MNQSNTPERGNKTIDSSGLSPDELRANQDTAEMLGKTAPWLKSKESQPFDSSKFSEPTEQSGEQLRAADDAKEGQKEHPILDDRVAFEDKR